MRTGLSARNIQSVSARCATRGKGNLFRNLPCGQEMIQVVGVIVLKPGFVNSVDFEQEMVVTIPPLQTKYVANIKRMWGKIKTFSAFEVI